MFKKYIYLMIFIFSALAGCKKFVEIQGPSTSANSANVYAFDATAASVLTGIYIKISSTNLTATDEINAVTVINGLASDEFTLIDTDPFMVQYATNDVLPQAVSVWEHFYSHIFTCNSAIEGISESKSLTPIVKQQLLGEAKFMRAFCYFYLVNLYGAVPLALSTNPVTNSDLPRTEVPVVYQQIVSDLKDAQSTLSDQYMTPTASITSERVRPNRGAATALLARVFLYMKDYSNAELEATKLINASSQYSLVGLNDVFLKNSKEAIWQIQPVGSDYNSNTKEGQFFIPNLITMEPSHVYLSNELMSAFESGDLRKDNWTKLSADVVPYYYAYKYKIGAEVAPVAEYSMLLRLAEQYLIRAEARAQIGRLTEAAEDINTIRSRAGLSGTNAITKEELLSAIENERRCELFAEWGHRWLDLKRTNRANDVLSSIKGSNWQTTDQLFPIPQYDIDANPSLKGHQNPGY